MTWTAEITGVESSPIDKLRIRTTASFTNGGKAEVVTYDTATSDDAVRLIQNALAQRERVEVELADPPTGPVSAPAPDVLSDDQKAKAAFLGDWRTLVGYRKAIEAGIIAADRPAVAALTASLAAAFRDEWADALR